MAVSYRSCCVLLTVRFLGLLPLLWRSDWRSGKPLTPYLKNNMNNQYRRSLYTEYAVLKGQQLAALKTNKQTNKKNTFINIYINTNINMNTYTYTHTHHYKKKHFTVNVTRHSHDRSHLGWPPPGNRSVAGQKMWFCGTRARPIHLHYICHLMHQFMFLPVDAHFQHSRLSFWQH